MAPSEALRGCQGWPGHDVRPGWMRSRQYDGSMSMGSFDERAATWDDDPAKRERAEAVGRAIRAAVPLDQSMRMLEYGAGTGLVTQALRDVVGPVTMADTSAGMRDVMEHKVASGAIRDARIWDIDLANQPVPDERFELVVTVMTLHHISQLGPVLAGFATFVVHLMRRARQAEQAAQADAGRYLEGREGTVQC